MTMMRSAPQAGVVIHRDMVVGSTMAIDPAARTMRFVASDETVDRYGDIIRAAGWELEAFRANPVLLFGHNAREQPVGRVESIHVVGTQLIADTLFRPEGDSQRSDEVWRAVEGGFLRAVSVGFMPTGPINQLLDNKGNQTGYEFTRQELHELSVVPVPANPQALAVAKSLGISEATQRLFFASGPSAVAQAGAQARQRSLHLLRLRRRDYETA